MRAARCIWDGPGMSDKIGTALTNGGFVPFGIGLPFLAARVARAHLSELAADPEVIAECVDASWNASAEDVERILTEFLRRLWGEDE